MYSGQSRKAVDLYVEFHQFEPEKIGSFGPRFRIPRTAHHAGEAQVMYYASDKLNPETSEDEGVIHYYHEHEGQVQVYRCDGEGRDKIPKWIWDVDSLWRIGVCEGFEYTDFDGHCIKAKAKKPYPEWYAIPSGKALLVIQNKRDVLAVVWGGDLHIEWRGVVG
jgi:hypothetical protein